MSGGSIDISKLSVDTDSEDEELSAAENTLTLDSQIEKHKQTLALTLSQPYSSIDADSNSDNTTSEDGEEYDETLEGSSSPSPFKKGYDDDDGLINKENRKENDEFEDDKVCYDDIFRIWEIRAEDADEDPLNEGFTISDDTKEWFDDTPLSGDADSSFDVKGLKDSLPDIEGFDSIVDELAQLEL